MTTATRQSEGGFTRRAFLLGLAGVGAWYVLKTVGTLELPEADVDVSEAHALLKHGIDEVVAVRAAMMTLAQRAPQYFRQPKCRDGRWRFITQLPDRRWCVWVLEQVGTGRYREVTAFCTHSQDYIKTIRDQCGNGSFFGGDMAVAQEVTQWAEGRGDASVKFS